MVSDNAPEFLSDELVSWFKRQGVQKMESSPYRPNANGLAERAVRTVKNAMKAFTSSIDQGLDFLATLQKVLFHYRCTASSRGKSPAQILFGTNLRVPVVSSFEMNERVGYRANTRDFVQPVTYIMNKGHNTAYVVKEESNGRQLVVASTGQLSPLPKHPSVSGQVADEADVVSDPESKETPEGTTELRRSSRQRKPPERYGSSFI